MKPRFTIRQTGFIIATIWFTSLLLVLPYVVALRVINDECKEIWPNESFRRTYTVGLFVFQYALPLTIIAIAYTKVVLRLREQAARMTRNFETTIKLPSNAIDDNWSFKTYLTPAVHDDISLPSPLPEPRFVHRKWMQPCLNSGNCAGEKEARRLQHNTKIVKMLVSVVLCYAICLLPNQVVWLWYEFGSGQMFPHIDELLTFGSIMVYINSSINPLLYAGMNEQFRKGFIGVLRCNWKGKPEMV